MPAHDLVVIGAGPGGYVAAIRAAQFGANVAIVEKEPALGGTCLRVGCIPSKALLESSERFHAAQHELAAHGVRAQSIQLDLAAMLKRKDEVVRGLTDGVASLMQKNKITRYTGHGRIVRPGVVQVEPSAGEPQTLETKYILIATGSRAATLKGVELDHDRIGTSTEALNYPAVPEHLVVIGAGYIGLELGSVWKRLGANVTVLEFLPRILPGMDAEIAGLAQKVFEKQGIAFRLGARVTSARVESSGKGKNKPLPCIVEYENGEPLRCDRVLLSVGRVPNVDALGLETAGVQLDDRGRIKVNEHFATTAPAIYAIGDVIRGPMLAHKAEEEGIAAVEYLFTGHCHVNYDAIPGIVYTEPEIAAVGRTEEELTQAGIAYKKGVFHFRGNGRARALGQTEGRVKILADAATDRILGVHILGPRAGDLIAEAAAAIEFGASAEDVARCSHAHPTLAECIKEAALAVHQRAIHA